jgi:hypothetical protein
MFGAFLVRSDPAGRPVATSVGGNRYAIGAGGLTSWLDGELTPADRVSLGDPEAVPYPLLRRAVAELWARGGGETRPVRAVGAGR